jgi:hypothetical protein
MARDDFSSATIANLAKRVAHRCSNPNCWCITTGPHTDEAKVINVGVAAHISAASAGGPRFDESLTPSQRKQPANAIWLCQKCAKLIDSDSLKYTKERLLEWKERAINAARTELETGRPPAPDQSTIQFAFDGWSQWKERGNLPGDSVVVIGRWSGGDIRYAGTIRLRSTQPHEEMLHHLRVQYRAETDILLEDEYAFPNDLRLPSNQWEVLALNHGLSKQKIETYQRADSLWFAAELVGSSRTFAWKLAAFDHTATIPVRG